MSQSYPNPQRRRPLTPEQRARIIRIRKKRRLQKRLKIAVQIAAALVVVLVVVLVGVGKKSAAPDVPQALSLQSIQAQPVDVQTEVQQPVDAQQTFAQQPDAQQPSAYPIQQLPGNAAQSGVSVTDPNRLDALSGYENTGKFNYDAAYIRAVMGMDDGTAPMLTADYSGIDPNKLTRWPKMEEGKFPVLYQAKTDERIIAVTVDDCYQGNNLMRIIQCALENNAKLTLFPIGENLAKSEVASSVYFAWQNGMEIENHTYTHSGLYHYDAERMSEEMWQQNQKLNSLLGVNYKQHFFRPKGGDERDDQRTQAYAKAFGMKGIAIWTQSGSSNSMTSLKRELAPGRIYLFHTTDHDVKQLLEFIPYAVSQGYRLVTLNDMFGLPENEISELSTVGKKPELEAFKVMPVSMQKDTASAYQRAVAAVQQRLIDLGWMQGEATGMFGKDSFKATGLFQMDAGMQVTGKADLDTQRRLFANDAPRGSQQRIDELMAQVAK